MTGLLMRKSKHIKASQTILFFFNDFVLSETDGERKAERLAPETKAEKKEDMLKDCI